MKKFLIIALLATGCSNPMSKAFLDSSLLGKHADEMMDLYPNLKVVESGGVRDMLKTYKQYNDSLSDSKIFEKAELSFHEDNGLDSIFVRVRPAMKQAALKLITENRGVAPEHQKEYGESYKWDDGVTKLTMEREDGWQIWLLETPEIEE